MKSTELKALRVAAGLTQKELAELAGIGTGENGRVMINRYENSDTHPIPHWRVAPLRAALAKKIAEA